MISILLSGRELSFRVVKLLTGLRNGSRSEVWPGNFGAGQAGSGHGYPSIQGILNRSLLGSAFSSLHRHILTPSLTSLVQYCLPPAHMHCYTHSLAWQICTGTESVGDAAGRAYRDCLPMVLLLTHKAILYTGHTPKKLLKVCLRLSHLALDSLRLTNFFTQSSQGPDTCGATLHSRSSSAARPPGEKQLSGIQARYNTGQAIRCVCWPQL